MADRSPVIHGMGWRAPRRPARRRSAALARCAAVVASALVLATIGTGWYVTRDAAPITTPNALATESATPAENILLLGIDSRTDAQGRPLPQDVLAGLHAGSAGDGGLNTDTMMLVHIAQGGGRASAISIPRDTYVQIAGGNGAHKINSAYAYGASAARAALQHRGVTGPQLEVESATAGTRNAVATVELLTGVQIDHDATVNMAAFDAISNAVGGVPICLNAPVDDPYSGATFPAGTQKVSGPNALSFVRQRHGLPHGDLDRIRRQQAFFRSMTRQVLRAGMLVNPVRLGALLGAVQTNIRLDQNWDLSRSMASLRNLQDGAVSFATLPTKSTDSATPDGQAVRVDPAAVRAFVAATFDPQSPSPAPGPPDVAAARNQIVQPAADRAVGDRSPGRSPTAVSPALSPALPPPAPATCVD